MVSIAFFCLVGVIAAALYAAFYGRQQSFEDRLAELAVRLRAERGSLETFDVEAESFGRMLFRWALQRMPTPAADAQGQQKVSHLLVHAGFRKSGALKILYLSRVVSAVACATMVLVLNLAVGSGSGRTLLYLMTATVVGAYLPNYYLARRARLRQEAIGRQLSDVLDLLVVCVEAGVGLFEAIKIVGDETESQGQEIGDELTLVAGEVGAGMSLGEALRSLAERTAVEDVKPLAATLIQSEQLGGQVGPALRASSDSMRTARRLRGEEAAQRAAIKILFPLVLFILPAMLIVVVGPAVVQTIRTLSF